MFDRVRALQIFGLSDPASEREIRAAHAALRAHVESRLGASDDDGFRRARREELGDLDRALEALDGRGAGGGRPVPRWVLAWAVVATLLFLAALAAVLGGSAGPAVLVGGAGEGGDGSGGFAVEGRPDGEPDGDASGAGGEARAAGPRARLVARSGVEGATLQVRTRDERRELVAEGPADETEYWLTPGSYALRVAHPDCDGAWEHELDARAGADHRLAPEPCDETGWLVVRSNVPEAELRIDGEPAGGPGESRHPLAPGEHEVRIAVSGYRAWEGIVDVSPGRVTAIRPRLERASAREAPKPSQAAPPPQPSVAAAARREQPLPSDEGWHEQARQWLLSRYDLDRSGALDSREELAQIPCDQWLSLEASHSQSRLGLTLIRFYGFDGNGWRSGALGVSDEIRDLAHERLKLCGLPE